jgi:hypothetical protein
VTSAVHEALKLICRYSRTWKDLRVELEQDWSVETFLELLVRSPAVVRGGFDQLQCLHLELAVDDGEEDLGRILETPGFGHEATQMLALFCSDAHQTSPTLPLTIHSSCARGDRSTKLARATSPDAPRDNVHPDDEFVSWAQLKNLAIQSDSICTCKVLDMSAPRHRTCRRCRFGECSRTGRRR